MEEEDRVFACLSGETPASMIAAYQALRNARLQYRVNVLERQIALLEEMCAKGTGRLLFAPSGVGCWEIDDEDGNSWFEAETFLGLLAAIDVTPEKKDD